MRPIDPRIHKVLDGEADVDSLPLELRRQVEQIESAARQLSVAPEGLSVVSRVMASVEHPAPRHRRLLHWLLTPRPIVLRVRPVWSVALAAALVGVALLPAREGVTRTAEDEGLANFVAHFPGAQSVAVAGSFNDWQPTSLQLEDQDQDGVWSGAAVLPAGIHEYMFLVDGQRWVADPLAGRYVTDDFGRENSVLIVHPRSL